MKSLKNKEKSITLTSFAQIGGSLKITENSNPQIPEVRSLTKV